MKDPSTKPKGATSYHQTSQGIIPRSQLVKLEIEGTKKAFEYIAEHYQKPISIDLILELHEIAFGWIFPDWAGKFRTIKVEFSGKEGVPPHQIHEQIINLCLDLTERINHLNPRQDNFLEQAIELLAWTQHRFVVIHPFQDYNGRVARMLTIHLLLQLGLPPAEIKCDTQDERVQYLEAMYAADDGNYVPLEKLIANAINESLVKINKQGK